VFEAAAGSLPGDSDKEPVEFLFPIGSRAEPLALLLPFADSGRASMSI
jgi:hypothetical protein